MVDIPAPTPTPTPKAAAAASQAAAATPAAPALSAEAQTMLMQIQALDPKRTGTDLKKLRVFYPRTPWNEILTPIRELETAGRLTKKAILNNKGGVSYHIYTWKEA